MPTGRSGPGLSMKSTCRESGDQKGWVQHSPWVSWRSAGVGVGDGLGTGVAVGDRVGLAVAVGVGLGGGGGTGEGSLVGGAGVGDGGPRGSRSAIRACAGLAGRWDSGRMAGTRGRTARLL